jgi:RHS repeat-associated protein
MTSLLHAISVRICGISLNCSMFVTLTLARLAQRCRVLRPRLRPARSRYAYSGFRRFACLLMVAVIFVQFSLFPPEVSRAAVEAVSAKAVNYGQDAQFWWHSSGWAARADRLRNEFLPNFGVQAQPKGWDGKGAPKLSRPTPPAVETQQDRERKIARIKIFPGDVELKTGEQVIFNAVAFDREDNPLGGLDMKWDALDEGKNQPLTVLAPGTFVSGVPGRFVVTAEIAGRKERVKVTVTGEARRANVKSRTEEPKSSGESRRVGSLRAPVSGDQKRIARRGGRSGAPALAAPLRASSAPTAARRALLLQDETGWNETNNGTAFCAGCERGQVNGRPVDGGAGSANFQFAAPGVTMDGRGINLNLQFNYNSRVWHKADSAMTFNIDRDAVAGWMFGFGKIVMAGDTYILIDGDGTRHPYEGTLRRNFPAPFGALQSFEANTTDGTFINYYAEGYKPQFDNSGGRNMVTAWAVLPNGTRIEYGAQANYAMYPTRITDAHGNFITITYLNNEGPNIQTITDPLGRVVYCYYDYQGLLTSVAVPNLQGAGYRAAVRLQYQWLTLSNAGANYGFAGWLTTKVRQNTIPVLRAIYYPATGTGYWFGYPDSYSPYGMLSKVVEQRGMTFDNAPWDQQGNIGPGVMSHEMVYNYPQSGGSYGDMPTYTQMTEDWAGRTTDAAPVTYFSVVDSGGQRTTTITRPDGAQLKQISDIGSGLLVEDGLYRDGVALSRSKVFWETGAYSSPRPTRTENWEPRGRVSSTTYSYDPGYGSRYNSPTDVRSYGYYGELMRWARTEYQNDANYNGSLQNSGTLWLKGPGVLSAGPIWVGSHIFNLVSVAEVYAGDGVTRLSRTENQYDGASLINTPGIVGHNPWYNPHTPPLEVCEQVPDMSDPDCRQECGPCQYPPCPEPPPDCDGYCPYIPSCHTEPQYDWRTGYRGNLTQVKSYADAASLDQNTAVVATRTYDVAGNVRVQSNSCCEQTTIAYTTNTQYAWPESQTSGSPSDASKQNTASATYDYWTGLVMTSTDANGRVSQTEYDFNTLRVVRETASTGGYTYHTYDDLNLTVADFVYEAGQSGANVASRNDKFLNGLGGVVKDVAYGKDYARDVVETKFDNLGRAWQQTRPYRANADWSPAEAVQLSTVVYDSLDRPVQTVSPDGSVVTRAYDQSPDPPGSSGQAGPTVKVTDPWGRERWARSDALGRMVEVAEPNPGGNGAVSGGAMYTIYGYDALGRLTQVSQGEQTRLFQYDSLGRLTRQKLAEQDPTLNANGQWVGGGQWSDAFFYDTRSNITRRVDARGVQTHYDFNDPLNRLLSVQYDKSGVPAQLSANIPDTPSVNYAYMASGDRTRAEFVSVSNGMGGEQYSYDSEGRLAQVRQTFAGREGYPILTNYTWDSLGRLKDSTYPQQYGAGEIRKKVEPAYDMASRLESLKFGGVTYASNPVYNASSQTTSLDVGAQMKELYGYDPKTGLITGQQVKRGADILVDLKYNYTLNNDPLNNGAKTGQLTSLTDLKNTARNRVYEYDRLGRLTKTKGGVDAFSNPAWVQNNSYDRYGNKGTGSQAPSDTVWVDDTLPAGAAPGTSGGDGWNWISSGPSPVSGSLSHISNIASDDWSPPPFSGNVSNQTGIVEGGHQHYFWGAYPRFPVRPGGTLYAYVFLDPEHPPREVMLQWGEDFQGWDHRAYWGENLIGFGTDGTNSRRYMGALPAAGGWVRLEVPASAVGLEGRDIHAMAFTLYGGRANWDLAGVEGVNVWYEEVCDELMGCHFVPHYDYENYVMMDDSIPPGATAMADGGYGWNWTGARPGGMLHQHYFDGATNTLNVNAGDMLYAWAWLDPANPPRELMLQWNDGSWEHRAYWGENKIGWGVDGTASRKYMGGLPAAGGWVKLEVPASAVGLEGRTVKGMAFTLYGGRAAWDKAGKRGTVPPPPPNPVTGRDGFDNLTYSTVNNRVISPGFAYAPDGSQTMAVIDNSGTRQQYRYDCANRLVQVLDGSGNVLAIHAYGASNKRLMSVEGGVTKYFAWVGGQIGSEFEAFGTNGLIWKTSYVYLGGRLLATTSGAGGTDTRFHHPDRLGTRLVTALDGTVVTEQFTMPFGNMQPFTSVYGGENPYQNPTLNNPSKKRFTSYVRSDVTTLDYAMNRFYSPQQGRFTQVDPIGMSASSLSSPQTLNLYSYCGNDPINHSDPDGLFFGKLFGWIGKAFKFLFKVAAIALFVAAMVLLPGMIATGGFWLASGAWFGWGSWAAVMGVAGVAGLAGWHNGKLGALAGAFLNRLGKSGNFRTPNTFPNATGVGGVSNFVQDDEGFSCKSNGSCSFKIATSEEGPVGVGQPGFWESLIPIWGSGRAAIDDFQNGRWGWGTLNAALAISDIFLVKSLITAGGKLLVRGAAKGTLKACFAAGTKIATAKGEKSIETISTGDLVWAYDEQTGKIALRKVVRTFERPIDLLVVLTVGEKIIKTTADHPFWVVGRGWVKGENLEVGDVLFTLNKCDVAITHIEYIEGQFTVYNFEVEGFHTYFVSPEQVLVHNKPVPRLTLPKNARTFQNVDDLYKHLEKYHGIDPRLASERLHQIKDAWDIAPDAKLLFDKTGGIWDPATRDFYGSLTEGGAKRIR